MERRNWELKKDTVDTELKQDNKHFEKRLLLPSIMELLMPTLSLLATGPSVTSCASNKCSDQASRVPSKILPTLFTWTLLS